MNTWWKSKNEIQREEKNEPGFSRRGHCNIGSNPLKRLKLLLDGIGIPGLSQKRKSILDSQINIPAFLFCGLFLAIICNLTLRQNDAQASRYIDPSAGISELKEQLQRDPNNYIIHNRLGDLYIQKKDLKSAMFHIQEAGRLAELYAD